MSELSTALVTENEMAQAEDFNYGFQNSIKNISKSFAVLYGTNSFLVGGSIKKDGTWGLIIDPLLIYNKITDEAIVEPIEKKVDIQLATTFKRIDVIEIKEKTINIDEQARPFIFSVLGKVYRNTPTKIRYTYEVNVIKGENSSNTAPDHTEGWFKLAEIEIPANAQNINACTIISDPKDFTNKDFDFIPFFTQESLQNKVKGIEENKVDKENGKGLSTNDFTDVLKTNLNVVNSLKHIHSNLIPLNSITQAKIDEWDQKGAVETGNSNFDVLFTYPSDSSGTTITGSVDFQWRKTQDNYITLIGKVTINESLLPTVNLLLNNIQLPISMRDPNYNIQLSQNVNYPMLFLTVTDQKRNSFSINLVNANSTKTLRGGFYINICGYA